MIDRVAAYTLDAVTKPFPKKVSTAAPDAQEKAREQAAAYDSIFASSELELDSGEIMTIPPHPDLGMLDDERMEAYEEILFEVDTEYEREPDILIPDRTLDTGEVIPGDTVRGALRRPYRKVVDGKSVLVKPPHSVRVVQAALGETEYKRLREGGRNAGDVWKLWGRQGWEAQQRQAADPKSVGGVVDLAAVPEADRP